MFSRALPHQLPIAALVGNHGGKNTQRREVINKIKSPVRDKTQINIQACDMNPKLSYAFPHNATLHSNIIVWSQPEALKLCDELQKMYVLENFSKKFWFTGSK